MFKYVLFLVLSTAFLSAETLSYSDLLKRSEPEQKVALEEASHIFNFNDYQFHSLECRLDQVKLYSYGTKCKTYVAGFFNLANGNCENKAQAIGYELDISPEVTFCDKNGALLIMPYY